MPRCVAVAIALLFLAPLAAAEGALDLSAESDGCAVRTFIGHLAPVPGPVCPITVAQDGELALDPGRGCYWSAYGDLRCWLTVTGSASATMLSSGWGHLSSYVHHTDGAGWSWELCSAWRSGAGEMACTFEVEPYGAIILGAWPGTCEPYVVETIAYAYPNLLFDPFLFEETAVAPFEFCVDGNAVPSIRATG